MSYKIVDGYLVWPEPMLELDEDGVPVFLTGMDRFMWQIYARNGWRQPRYLADGSKPYDFSEEERKDGKVYVVFYYGFHDGNKWREAQWYDESYWDHSQINAMKARVLAAELKKR